MGERRNYNIAALYKFSTVVVFLFLFPTSLIAADFTLRWDPNQEEDLGGYKLYYKEKSYGEPYNGIGVDQGDSPISVPLTELADPDNPQFTITGLPDNKIFFIVLTAYDDADPANESGYSNVISNLRISQPVENFGINKTSNYTAFPIAGRGLTESSIQILGNGVLLGVAEPDPDGNFAIDVDLSVLSEGTVALTAKQKESTSYPVTGIYDLTNPSVSSWELRDDEIIITFDEPRMQNARLEASYSFSPSLTFRASGGITQYNTYSYRLSMTSIPDYEILALEMTGITDAAGNPLQPASIIINDADEDQMADDWEVATGLDPTVPNSGADSDGDGFSNLREYQARTDPHERASAPIVLMDSIPQPHAGILNSAWVHEDTSVAMLIGSVHGIDSGDPQSVRFTIDDGELAPYSRNLGFDSIRVIEVETDNGLNLLWVVYDRSLETDLPMAYTFDANILLTVEVEDIVGNVLPPVHFEFKVESEEEHNLAMGSLPEYTFVDPSGGAGHDTGIEVVSGDLTGARIEYNSNEPMTPLFGPIDGIEPVAAAGTENVGLPLNLMPHTVFNTPVKVFLPLPADVDINDVWIFYNNGVEWQPALDDDGNLLPGGQGLMVPGSRVNHTETSPQLIEFQVYHFSAAQGGFVVIKSGDPDNSSGTKAFVSCFIDTAADNGEFAFGLSALLLIFGTLGMLLLQCFKRNGS